MKNIFKFILVYFLSILIFNFKVSAGTNDSTLTTRYIDNVWSFHYRNGKVFTYGQLPFRYLNGKMAYCIDPPTPINTNIYSSYNDFSVSGYSDDVKKQMELIAHYGYEYPGHDTIKYYMATQELIWLFSPDEKIKWTVSNTSSSEEINIEKEKNDIMNLVNNHNKLPSFVNVTYIQNYGTTLKLKDNNNVLGNYDIITDLNYKINGQNLDINLSKLGIRKVYLKSKYEKNVDTIVYKSDTTRSQMMAIFGFRDIKEGNFSINSEKVTIKINKYDKETGKYIKDQKTTFTIKNIDTDEFYQKKLNITAGGFVAIGIPKGKYEIEEIIPPDGYIVSDEKKIINIDDNLKFTGLMYKINVYNEVPKGKINIEKVNDDGELLENVEIGIYDEKYNLIKKLVTDKNGRASIDNLNLGVYYLKELSTVKGHVLDDSYHKVIIKYKDMKTKIIEENIKLVNKKIKCDITYISLDKNKVPLPGVKIDVYNDKNEIIYKGVTNNSGKIIIKDLPYGDYYIKQVYVPKGYILNEKIEEFRVNDISCLADIVVINEKTKMPITSSEKKNYISVISIILVGIIYAIKKIF